MILFESLPKSFGLFDLNCARGGGALLANAGGWAERGRECGVLWQLSTWGQGLLHTLPLVGACMPPKFMQLSCSRRLGLQCSYIPAYGLQGSLPAGGWDLPGQLTWLDLSHNSIQGSVGDLCFPPSLKQAYMDGTGLEGSLPDAWWHPTLETLWLANTISGQVGTCTSPLQLRTARPLAHHAVCCSASAPHRPARLS